MSIFISQSGRTPYKLPRLLPSLKPALLATVGLLLLILSVGLPFAMDALAGNGNDKPGNMTPVAAANATQPTTATTTSIPQIIITGKRLTPAQKRQADEADAIAEKAAVMQFAGMQAVTK